MLVSVVERITKMSNTQMKKGAADAVLKPETREGAEEGEEGHSLSPDS